MAKLSLRDAVDLAILTDNPVDLSRNEDMQEYVSEMKSVGTDILKKLSHEELAGAVSFLQASATAEIMEENPMVAMLLIAKQEVYTAMMLEALRFSIGLAVSEEWR